MATQRLAQPKKPSKSRKKTPEDYPTTHATSILHALSKITLTETQAICVKTFSDNEITFVQGPAGTAKTFVACYSALKLLAENRVRRIILVKPATPVKGQDIGFLPGTLEEKINAAMESYRGNFLKIIDENLLKTLEAEGLIRYCPLTFMRGLSLDGAALILDEAQNTDFRSLILFITRLGKKSKMLLAGDVSQYDIDKNLVKLPTFIRLFENVAGVGSFKFTNADIVRNRILIEITEIYEKWKFENNA